MYLDNIKALVSATQSARSICLSGSGAQKFKIERERNPKYAKRDRKSAQRSFFALKIWSFNVKIHPQCPI